MSWPTAVGDNGFIHCVASSCEAKIKNHYHSKADAHDAGWFFQKDGSTWCPAHKPEWVDAWRTRKAMQ